VKIVTGMLLLLTGMAAAGNVDLEGRLAAVAQGTTAPLAKAGALTSTTYYSTYYNMDFKCPTGWTITSVDSTADRILLNVAKTGRNSVLVYGSRFATPTEAVYRDSYATFLGVRTAFGASSVSDEAPLVYAAFDTTVSGLHVSYVQLEYETAGGTRIYDLISGSRSTFSHFVAYSASLSDYDANYEDYDAVGEGLDFINVVTIEPPLPPNPLPKGSSGVTWQGNTIVNPNGLKIEFLDAKGGRHMVSKEKRIKVDPAQKLFLKIHER
jgi:hypothetical protein